MTEKLKFGFIPNLGPPLDPEPPYNPARAEAANAYAESIDPGYKAACDKRRADAAKVKADTS